MSFYSPSTPFARPKAYDPELAQRVRSGEDDELVSLARRIADTQQRALRRELGLSDDESDASEDEEESKSLAADDGSVREELEQLQQRYLLALKDVHAMGERERKAIEQLAKLKRMSKSQVVVLTNGFRAKLTEQAKLVAEALASIEDDGRAEAAGSLRQAIAVIQKQVSATAEAASSATLDTGAEPEASTSAAALAKQLHSLEDENALLRRCLSDMAAGELPLRFGCSDDRHESEDKGEEPPTTSALGHVNKPTSAKEEGAPSAFSAKLNGLSQEELKTKLVKALKVAKMTQSKLVAVEQEKESLMALLSEARTELERKTSGEALQQHEQQQQQPEQLQARKQSRAAPIDDIPAAEPGTPPLAPATTSSGLVSASKAEKIREKFDKLKSRLSQSEQECANAKALLKDMAKELEATRAKASAAARAAAEAARPKVDAKQLENRAAGLQAALDKEKRASAAIGASRSALYSGLGAVRQQLGSEKKSIRESKDAITAIIKANEAQVVEMIGQLKKRVQRKQDAISGVVEKYQREFKERKRLFNLVQELRGNIRVLCRVRPALDFEKKDIAVRLPEEGTVELTNVNGREKQWEFDHVFRSNATNADVFAEVADLCTSILDGYNVCIFAYGQTGSGKTHTMEGPPSDPGVNFRALEQLFRNMEERKRDGEWTFEVQVSLLEIYNEQIRDLLADCKAKQKAKLEVKASKHGMHVPGLTMVAVADHKQVLKLMTLGKKNRTVAATQMNADSSRSHSMLSTYVVARNSLTGETARGKLHLIDLAGSERVSKSGVKGAQLAEATNINKSLSALGDVIQARANKQGHVPFRNSTLTYLLQDSLSADSKTLMFVQVSPVGSNAGETQCSLNFAARARQVELGRASKHTSK